MKMPSRRKIFELPIELREELERRLVSSGFGGYCGLSDWLAEQGFSISKSALHKYGQELEAEFESAMADVRYAKALAKAYAADDPDDSQAFTGAIAAMGQHALLKIMLAIRKADQDPTQNAKLMAQVSQALTSLGRLSISQSRHANDVRRQVAEDLARRVEESDVPLTPESFRALVAQVYG